MWVANEAAQLRHICQHRGRRLCFLRDSTDEKGRWQYVQRPPGLKYFGT
jgi:hypothetical protein